MKENDDTFNFHGFLEDDEKIEIPDPVKKKKRPSSFEMEFGVDPEILKELSGKPVEEIKNLLPPELLSMFDNLAKIQGSDSDDILKEVLRRLTIIEEGLSEGDDDESLDESEDTTKPNSTMNLKYLYPNKFGAYRCTIDPEFHTHLYEFLDNNPANIIAGGVNKTLDTNGTTDVKEMVSGLLDHVVLFQLDEITKKLPLNDIEDFEYVGSTDTHVMFFAKMKDHNQYGFFVAVYKDADTNKYMAVIPEFYNTFWIDTNDEPHLYNINKDDKENDLKYFEEDRISKNVTFYGYDPNLVDFAVRFMLAPVEKTIITPTQLGTIKNVMPVINKSDSILKVGTITPFDTDDARQFIFEADLNTNDAPYSLYFNFGATIEKESLRDMAEILFKVDLNNCPLLQCSDLRYTTDSDHIIYINVDLGQF